jgi:hypothetical protein
VEACGCFSVARDCERIVVASTTPCWAAVLVCGQLALRTPISPLDFPFLLQCSVSFLLVPSEECVDSPIAVFVDAADLSLLLPYEQGRRGPHFLNLLPSFYDDRQYFGLLVFGQGEALREYVQSVFGATSRIYRPEGAADSCNPASLAKVTDVVIKLSNKNIRFIRFIRFSKYRAPRINNCHDGLS